MPFSRSACCCNRTWLWNMAQLQSCSGLVRGINPSVRQQIMLVRVFKPAARCRPASAQHLSSHTVDQTVSTSTSSSHLPSAWSQMAPAAAALAPFLATGAAWADDLDVYAAASDPGGTTEFLVTAMATTVFGLLLLVTGGVSEISRSPTCLTDVS